jgi:hypothetical protein
MGMRISSRGAVSMGPIGWLICLPFLVFAGAIYVAGFLLVLLLKGITLLVQAAIARHRARALAAASKPPPEVDTRKVSGHSWE